MSLQAGRTPKAWMSRVAATLCAVLVAGSLTSAQQGQAPPAPPPQDFGPSAHAVNTFWDWMWGELIYGQSYVTKLTVNNLCKAPQAVNFFITDPFYEGNDRAPDGSIVPVLRWRDSAPDKPSVIPEGETLPVSARAMLAIPQPGCVPVGFGGRGTFAPTVCSTEVPPGATDFEVIIRTPAPPDPKVVRAAPDPMMVYDVVMGKLVIQTKGDPPACMPTREEYIPSGHVHLDPNPDLSGGPRCRDWWDREEKPRGLTRDCTREIRDLALSYLRVTLKPIVEKHPEAWAWLPGEDQILAMSVEELIAMKVKSRATMRGARRQPEARR